MLEEIKSNCTVTAEEQKGQRPQSSAAEFMKGQYLLVLIQNYFIFIKYLKCVFLILLVFFTVSWPLLGFCIYICLWKLAFCPHCSESPLPHIVHQIVVLKYEMTDL